MQLKSRPTTQLLHSIDEQQAIQKRNPPTSVAWQSASRALKPLFAEMARRQGRQS